MNELLNAALEYAGRGFSVFPLHCVRDGLCSCGFQCSSPGKHPRTPDGLKSASTDFTRIREWWTETPDANIGLATGHGLAVLDIDPDHGGDISVVDLGKLPDTPIVSTGSGGTHYYFAGQSRNRTGILPGIDLRGDGGYVVAPPSNHLRGKYEWDEITRDLPFATLPGLPEKAYAEVVTESEPIRAGNRNSALASIAGTLRKRGLAREDIAAALLGINGSRCDPPLPRVEVEAIANSVSKYTSDEGLHTVAMSVPRFLELEIPPQRFLVDSIWPEQAIGFVAGPPKSFKSFLALDLAYALASGQKFLGSFQVPAPRKVLLIEQESSLSAFKERVQRVAAVYGEAPSLYVIKNHNYTLESESSIEDLRKEIDALRPDLTILDPLASFIMGDENNAQQMGAVVRLLRNWRNEYRTGFLIVHHTAKGSGDVSSFRGGQRMRGSSAFYAASEAALYVDRPDYGELYSRVAGELKDGQSPSPFTVHLHPDTACLEVSDEFAIESHWEAAPLDNEQEAWYNK